MKYITLLLLCLNHSLVSFAQKDIFGADLGLGSTVYLKTVTPTLEGDLFHLTKISSHFSIGEEFGSQQYSFTKKITSIPPAYTQPAPYILSVNEKCAYLFLSPKIVYSIGKNQKVHAALSAGPGYGISGSLTNHVYALYYSNPFKSGPVSTPVEYEEHDTKSIRKLIFRTKLSLIEEIDHSDGIILALYEEFTYIPTVNSPANNYYYEKNRNKLSFPVYYFAVGFSLSGFLDKKMQHATKR